MNNITIFAKKMKRSRTKSIKEYSSLSDESLAKIIMQDFKRCPSEFTPVGSSEISDSNYFLKNTSARTISPILKWL